MPNDGLKSLGGKLHTALVKSPNIKDAADPQHENSLLLDGIIPKWLNDALRKAR